jgi:hypothetical protein
MNAIHALARTEFGALVKIRYGRATRIGFRGSALRSLSIPFCRWRQRSL